MSKSFPLPHYVLLGPFNENDAASVETYMAQTHEFPVTERMLGQMGPAHPSGVPNASNPPDLLTMTFTREEWRLIAIACSKVSRSGLINAEYAVPIMRNLSQVIAKETGRDQ